jgi:DNA (cytosine-5)-methyltransferase 1
MITPQYILDLNRELVIDNFAGGGGASTGIELALGRHVDHAVNHNPEALGMHRINHPQTVHHCEDVFDIDPGALTEGRPVGAAWFSPDCKHFSKAKGGKPLDKKIRGLVLVMLRWAKLRTRVMFMENVEEIQTWGPLVQLVKDGKKDWYPDPAHKGRTWRTFLQILGAGCAAENPDLPEILETLDGTVTRAECVRGFGYDCEVKEIRACDHGAPTIRRRLYMVARCAAAPIEWPSHTHFSPKELPAARKRLGRGAKPHRIVAECIDWHLPCPSIFLDREAARKARCRRPLAPSTLRRIATGIDRYVLKAKEPFWVSLAHQGGDRVEPVSEPARTLTGEHRGEKALVEPTVAPFVTEHANSSNQRSMPADEPLRTQCANVKGGHFAMVSANLMVNTTKHNGGAVDEPAPTIPTGGHHAVVTGTLVQTGYGEREGQAPRALDLEKPLGTVVSGGKHALAAAHLTKFNTGAVGRSLNEPAPTVCSGSHSPDTHGGAASTQGLVAAYLAQHNGGFNTTPGHDAREPLSTVSATGSQQQVVAGTLAAYYGNDKEGQGVDEPARTVTTKERFGLVESTGVAPMTAEQIEGARRVAVFLREHGVKFEGEFATVAGFVIVDIGMRMLTPRELFRAQGFPESYVIDRAWVIDPQTGGITEVRLTKEQQIRMCGNSVCPPVARALIAANVPELCEHTGKDGDCFHMANHD